MPILYKEEGTFLFKNKKNKILILLFGIVVIIASFAIWASINISESKAPDPIPSPIASSKKIDLMTTLQYNEASPEIGQFYTNGSIGETETEYMVLAMWTTNSYIKNSIMNPYFITDYWGSKDNYSAKSLEKYLSPSLSSSLNDEFIEAAISPNSSEFKTYFESKIFLPSEGLTVSPECYNTWDEEYCFSETPTITDMSYTGISKDSIKVDATIKISTLYQKKDAPEGNLIVQDREYKMTFILNATNLPKTKDAILPIMTISNITSSLVINEPTDFLINESN